MNRLIPRASASVSRISTVAMVLALIGAQTPAKPAQESTATVATGVHSRETLTQTYTANGSELRLSIVPIAATVAERIEMQLDVQCSAGSTVQWPDWSLILDRLRVVRITPIAPRTTAGGLIAQGVNIRLEPFLPGKHEIPPMDVVIRAEDGQLTRIRTDGMALEVRSLLGSDDGTSLSQPKGILTVEHDATMRTFVLVSIVTGGAALAVLMWTIAARMRDRRAPPPAHSKRLSAAARLNFLREELNAGRIDSSRALDETADAVRVLIEGVSGVATKGLTTEAILTTLAGAGAFSAEAADTATGLLRELDQLRFSSSAGNVAAELELVERAISLESLFSYADGESD